MTRLIPFPTAHGVDLVDEKGVVAVDLVRTDAYDGTYS